MRDHRILLDGQRADAAEPTSPTADPVPVPAAEPSAALGEATGTADKDEEAMPPSRNIFRPRPPGDQVMEPPDGTR